MNFEKEIGDIYRLKVPFDGDVYTSLFLIRTKQGNVLVDCATYASDVDEYILPALRMFKLKLEDIRYLVLTHKHSDHAGGAERLSEFAPTLEVVSDVREIFLNGLIVYELKGHTLDCIGILDKRSDTLIAGDGLQGYGVGKYRCSLESKEEYIKTIDKIKKDGRIKNILFSHAYEPWYKYGAFGREEVENCLQDCIEYVNKER